MIKIYANKRLLYCLNILACDFTSSGLHFSSSTLAYQIEQKILANFVKKNKLTFVRVLSSHFHGILRHDLFCKQISPMRF